MRPGKGSPVSPRPDRHAGRLKLFLCTEFETPWASGEWRRIAATWGLDAPCEVVGDPEAADAVLITLCDLRDPYPAVVEKVKRLALRRAARDRVFVFDTSDMPAGLFPGLYASLRRRLFSRARHRTSSFLQSFNEYIDLQPYDPRPPLLCSFQGNLTSPVRGRLFNLPHRRDDVVIERTEPFWSRIGEETTAPFKRRYAETIGNSRFVLCPRGNGTSSYRLFETMQSGRVPVIIADPWVPSDMVPWHACSLRVPERAIDRVVEICEGADPQWRDMAQEARRAWESWFSPVGLARLIAESIEGIWQSRPYPERVYACGWPWRTNLLRLRGALVRGKVRGLQLAARFEGRGRPRRSGALD